MSRYEPAYGFTLIYTDPSVPLNSEGEPIEVLWAHDLVDRENQVTFFLESAAWEDSWGRLGPLEPGYWTVHWVYSAYGPTPFYETPYGFEFDVIDITRTPDDVIREYERTFHCPWFDFEGCATSADSPEPKESERNVSVSVSYIKFIQRPKPPTYPKCQTVGYGFRIVPHPQ